MRISKDLAYEVANKMTQGSLKLEKEARKEYSDMVKAFYEKQIPEEVSACFKKHPTWLMTRNSVYFNGHGFNNEHVDLSSPVISNAESKYGDPILKLTPAISEKLIKAKRAWEKAKEHHDTLRDETRQALLNLGTFARIRENLPEAAPFLPPPLSNALVVNFDSLRKRLEKQPEVPENAKLKKQYAAVLVK